ncbi:MAG: hypothetical protein ACRBF0_21440 [Calditrichia bacterium]
MTVDKQKVLSLVMEAVTELNELREEDEKLDTTASTMLYGEGSSLDSLSLVNLIVIAEEKIEDQFDAAITLADEKAMSLRNSPFRSIDSLADYICTRLTEEA